MNDTHRIKIGETIVEHLSRIDELHIDVKEINEKISTIEVVDDDTYVEKQIWEKRLLAVRAWITDTKRHAETLIKLQDDFR